MNMDATLIKADGTKENIQPQNGTDFSLEELKELIGCKYIEVIDTGDPVMIMIGDESARLHDDYIVNKEATRIYREGNGITGCPRQYFNEVMESMGDNVIMIDDPDEEPYTIAGNVVYCTTKMLR